MGDNTYVAFYEHRRKVIKAETLYDAKQKAVQDFGVPKSKRNLVHIELSHLNGVERTIDPASL